jgi:hypothetical protein
MKPPSKKNVDLILHDVRRPIRKEKTAPKLAQEYKRQRISKKVLFFAFLLVFVSVFIYFLLFSNIAGIFLSFTKGIFAHEPMFPSLSASADSYTSSDRDDLSSSFSSLKDMLGVFGEFKNVISISKGIRGDISDIRSRGLQLFFNDGGEELIAILKRIYTNISWLNEFGIDINSKFSGLGASPLQIAQDRPINFSSIVNGLGSFIGFLDYPERRVIVVFENHSEMRPTGGFIGSYADVTLSEGSINDISVNDIYYPDRRLDLKIIPPIQLQTITIGWGARDANWFFDFPISAEKVLEFLEASNVYVGNRVKFDGLVALNSHVVEDVLSVVGPIDVPEYGVTLNKDNFIYEVREEVEESREKDRTQNPKQILSIIMPTIIERLQVLNDDQKNELAGLIVKRAADRDIKFYFRDDGMQTLFDQLGLTGRIYDMQEEFIGDYLAVINTNVAGGKSDLFINQEINLDSRIDADGAVHNSLSVKRTHFGQNEAQPLYRAVNQNFIKIFTTPNSALESISGATPKIVKPQIDYKLYGYSTDPILAEVENTRDILEEFDTEKYVESGRNVFAAWFTTPPGESRTINLRYQPTKIDLQDATKYKFVFEKQPGINSVFKYTLSAPPGYIWLDSNGPVFSYENKELPGRIILEPTLVKNE